LEQTVTQQASSFDRDLQMYRELPGPVSLARLRFLRWLVEHERLEHQPAGPPSGEFAEPPILGPPVPEGIDTP
jgi:hypothetical protein